MYALCFFSFVILFCSTFSFSFEDHPIEAYLAQERRNAWSSAWDVDTNSVDQAPSVNNPCGYGPSPSLNPREWKNGYDNLPWVPKRKRHVYNINEVGKNSDSALDKYLLNALNSMKTPNYISHKAFFTKFREPVYDRYSIHRFNFKDENIPLKATVEASQIMPCTKDSVKLCPTPLMSLCTSNGAIICVAKQTSVVTCKQNYRTCVDVVVETTHRRFTRRFTSTIHTQMQCVSDVYISGNVSLTKTDTGATTINFKENNGYQKVKKATWNDGFAKHNYMPTSGLKPFCATLIALPVKSTTNFFNDNDW